MAEKICVEIGVFLYDFGVFQEWIFAILYKMIKKTRVIFCLNSCIIKLAVETIF